MKFVCYSTAFIGVFISQLCQLLYLFLKKEKGDK